MIRLKAHVNNVALHHTIFDLPFAFMAAVLAAGGHPSWHDLFWIALAITTARAAALGASGIVFMMIVMSSLGGMKNGCIPITLILVLVLYIGGEIVDGVVLRDNISQLTHIIGGICGALLGISMR